MSNESSACTEPHEHSQHCSGCAGGTIHHVCGKTPCAAGADAQREPELSNAEIARRIVDQWAAHWDLQIPQDDEGRAMAIEGDFCSRVVKALDAKDTRSRPTVAHPYSGDLWLDDDGTANFKFHIEGGDFTAARHVLEKFIACLQDKLSRAGDCPYFEKEKK